MKKPQATKCGSAVVDVEHVKSRCWTLTLSLTLRPKSGSLTGWTSASLMFSKLYNLESLRNWCSAL